MKAALALLLLAAAARAQVRPVLAGALPRPLRVAVIGAGPAGFYAAEALLKQTALPVAVDLIDQSPAPYGLARSGVAPDHPKAKAAIASFEAVAADPRARFFGGVRLGRDVSPEDLARFYDRVIYATGAEEDRRLGVPGEDLEGVVPASRLTRWYNARADAPGAPPDLSVERAVVVGAGAVALAAARLLAQNPERLAATDISAEALAALRASRIREVVVVSRRGPGQTAFSPVELKELGELDGADLVVRAGDLEGASAGPATLAARNIAYMKEAAARGEGAQARKVRLVFYANPVEILGEGGRVVALRAERTRLEDDGKGGLKAVGTGEIETIPAGLVVTAAGWTGKPLPGVPFDAARGVIPTADGRVLGPDGSAVPGAYAAGWAKRGAQGLLFGQKADAAAVVKTLLSDAAASPLDDSPQKAPEAVSSWLTARGVRFVTFADWGVLDALERAAGAAAGKLREKFPSIDAMFEALERARR